MKKLTFITFILLLAWSCERETDSKPFIAENIPLDEIHQILITGDNGYLIAGVYDSKITFIKTNSEFNTIWTKNNFEWGNVNPHDLDYYSFDIKELFQNSVGNYICIGSTWEGGDVVIRHTLIIELDQEGREIRNKKIENYSLDKAIRSPDGYLLIGYYLIKLDENIDLIWKEDRINDEYWINNATLTSDEIYVLTGRHHSNSSTAFLQKLDSHGNEIWNKQISDRRESFYSGYDLVQLNDEGFLVVGRTGNIVDHEDFDCYLVRTNSEGDTIWTNQFDTGKKDFLDEIVYTSNDQFIIKGIRDYPDIEYRSFFIKADITGKVLDTYYNDKLEMLRYDPSGFFILAHQYEDGLINLTKIPFEKLFN